MSISSDEWILSRKRPAAAELKPLLEAVEAKVRQYPAPLPEILHAHRDQLAALAEQVELSAETLAAGLETWVVLRSAAAASARESLGDERSVGYAYSGRLLLEILQNLHDALASVRPAEHMQIGRFGIGIKAIGRIVDRIRISSGPWQLVFGDERLKAIRPFELPLFTYPLPDEAEWPTCQTGQVDARISLFAAEIDGRWWLEVSHRGATFDAADVLSFVRRRASEKQTRAPASSGSGPGSITRLAFRLMPGEEEALRMELEALGGDDLLFLPHLKELEIEVEGCRRIVSASPIETWTEESLRYELVECTSAHTILEPPRHWLLCSALDRRAVAFPVAYREPSPLYAYFRISDATTSLPLRVHLPGLELDQTRERLADSEQARQKNGAELSQAVELAVAALAGLDKRIRRGAGGSLPLLERLISDLPGPLIMPSTGLEAAWRSKPGTPVAARDAGTTLSVWLRRRLGDAPCIACLEGDSVQLRSPRYVVDVLPSGLEAARKLFGSPLEAGGQALPTDKAAAVLARLDGVESTRLAVQLGLTRPPEAVIARAIERCFDGCEGAVRRGRALLVAGAHVKRAARAGCWLEAEGYFNVSPLPLAVDHLPGSDDWLEVRLPLEGEPAPRAELYSSLGWASIDLAAYDRSEGLPERLWHEAGVVKAASPDEVLRKLYERRAPGGDGRPAVEIAVACLLELKERHGLRLKRESPLLMEAVEHLKHYGWNYDHWVVKGCTDRAAQRAIFWAIHFSGLMLPTRSGRLRRACELTRHRDAPMALQVDIDTLKTWVGEEHVYDLLDVCSVWHGESLHVLVRRPLEQDIVYDHTFSQWRRDWPLSPEWQRHAQIHTVPRVEPGARTRRVELRQRLPLSRPVSAFLKNTRATPWYECAGHLAGDQLAALIDVPKEYLDGEGRVDPARAAGLSRQLEATKDLRWSYFIDLRDWRGGNRYWERRASAVGDIPSPALVRLRQTAWLEPADGCAHQGLLRPCEATRWTGSRLSESPVRLLPVARSKQPLDALLVAGALEADPDPDSPLDPRWLLARLFELTAAVQLDDEHLSLWRRLISHLATQALPLPKRVEGPGQKVAWQDHYAAFPGLAQARSRIGAWIVDAGETGFVGPDRSASWSRIRLEDLVEQLPVPVRTKAGLEMVSLEALRNRPRPIIYPHGASGAELMALEARFDLAELPPEALDVCHLLRLPYFLPRRGASRAVGATSSTEATLALTTLLQRLRLPILRLIEAVSVPAVGFDQLQERWTEHNFEVFSFDPAESVVQLAGFPDEPLSLDGSRAPFVSLSEWRKGLDGFKVQIGVLQDLDREAVSRHLWQVAAPLVRALGIGGTSSRMNVECLLHRIMAVQAFDAVLEGRAIPTEIGLFMAERGIAEAPETIQALAQSLIDRLEPVLSAMNCAGLKVPIPAAERAHRRLAPMLAWESICSALPIDAATCPLNEACLAGHSLEGLAPALSVLKQLDAEALGRALSASGLEVPELVDRSRKDGAYAAIVDRLRPWWSSWSGAPRLMTWREIQGLSTFVGGLEEFRVEIARWLKGWQEAPTELREAAAAAVREQRVEPLERLFLETGYEAPGALELRRAAWEGLIAGLLGRARGLAAAVLLAGDDGWKSGLEERSQQIIGQAEAELMANAEAAGWLELNARNLATWAAHAFPDAGIDPEQTSPEGGTVDAVVDWFVRLAETLDAGGVDRLLESIRRPIHIAGQVFVGAKEARRYLEEKAGSLRLDPDRIELCGGGALVVPQESEGRRTGRGRRRFSAKAGVLGEEGERYVKRVFEADGWWVRSVATRDEARQVWRELETLATSGDPLGRWAARFVRKHPNAEGAHEHPGFDLLMVRTGQEEVEKAIGIEVKCTDEEVSELDFEWTGNELRAAQIIREAQTDGARAWCWPVDAYHLVCVTRLWKPLGDGFDRPRLLVLEDPLGMRSRMRITRHQVISHRVEVTLNGRNDGQ